MQYFVDKKKEIFLKSRKPLFALNVLLMIGIVSSLGFNSTIISRINGSLGIKNDLTPKVSQLFTAGSASAQLSGDLNQDAINFVLSQGVPEVYGEEMGVSFDDVQGAIDVMRQYDPGYGNNKIVLAGSDLEQYTRIGLKISCEYCCSAKSIIRSDAQAACGCAHSQAMRGLLAYLIKYHDAGFSEDAKLRELARWKGMYFPKQMIKKIAGQLQGEQDFTPDTASLVLNTKLPDYGSGAAAAPIPSDIENLPSMVGGC